jgi:hypothetical protein
MDVNTFLINQIIFIIGEMTLILVFGVLLFAVVMVTLVAISIRQGKIYFPSFLKAGMVLLEGLSRALFRLFGLEDNQVHSFFIQLHNTMNKKAFEGVPVRDRAIFFPQCLRSSKCPADLTPEGLKCKCCGLCTIGYWLPILERMGYRIFSVPGSSFIKRMVKKYHPQAIIGIGCLSEVKEGLEMSDKLGLVSMGVVTLKDGCVETLVNWEEVLEIALLGVELSQIPPEIIQVTDTGVPI